MISSSAPRTSQPRPPSSSSRRRESGGGRSRAATGLRVRRLARGADDGYHSHLVPGLRSSSDARELAEDLAFAAARLSALEIAPPGLYELVRGVDPEEGTWLAFLIAYLGPLEEPDPFAEIARVRTSWAQGELPELDGVRTGPRSAHDPARGTRTLEAYRAWALRSGSQAAAFTGDEAWSPERRFERTFERLALPGLHRDARFELLTSLGRLGIYELEAGSLKFGGGNEVTLAAKRALGIGDSLLLERRAADLARACGVSLGALDLAFHRWGSATEITAGVDVEPDPETLERGLNALGLV